MGFDISYHPINEKEINKWYFAPLSDPALTDSISAEYGIEEFYIDKYKEVLRIAAGTTPEDSFERSHGYYLAVIHGLIRRYYYTRGSAFSFLIEEQPYFERYIKDFKTLVPAHILNPIHNRLDSNYSSGVFIPADQVDQLLSDYENDPQVKTDLDKFFSDGRINVFLRALEDAKTNALGLLEATEIIEPNPLNLNESACYSNLLNCDQEGAYLFKAAAMEQFREIEERNNMEPGEIASKATHEVINIPAVEQQEHKEEKKGFWKKLFG